jgi:regulatory protein
MKSITGSSRVPSKGGTVTRVSPQQSTAERMNVFLDDRYAFSMSARALSEEPISVGDVLTEADVERLLAADEPDRATTSALNLLTHRSRSERELRQRLRQKGYTTPAIDATIQRVRDWGYLDDERFAEAWVEQRQASRPRSRRALAGELREKGVDREIIEAAIKHAEIDEVADARVLALDKWRKDQGQPPEKRRQRTASYLARRGYSWQVAKQVIEELAGEDLSDERESSSLR